MSTLTTLALLDASDQLSKKCTDEQALAIAQDGKQTVQALEARDRHIARAQAFLEAAQLLSNLAKESRGI